MAMLNDCFDRNERFFGKEGQATLRKATVAVVGIGGLGTHVIQQLCYLGIGTLYLIDNEELENSNRNRYIGVWHDDKIPDSPKVFLGQRHANLIDPDIHVEISQKKFISQEAIDLIRRADYVFGCLDSDGVRYVLNEACLAYERPLIDLASDIPEPQCYGGRVVFVTKDGGCLHCRQILDPKDVRQYLTPGDMLENESEVYGIDHGVLGDIGPSVVSINGVVASIGVTEFMLAVTGLRAPYPHLEYRGHNGIVVKNTDPPLPDCYFCKSIKGKGDAANLERYFTN